MRSDLLVPSPPGSDITDARRRRGRVAVLVDRSPDGWQALQHAIALADPSLTVLELVAVTKGHRWLDAFSYLDAASAIAVNDERRRERVQAEQALAAARDEVPASVTATSRVLYGAPRRVLLQLARSGEYELLVCTQRSILPRFAAPLAAGLMWSRLRRTGVGVFLSGRA
jgi:hypothetical protein